MKFMYVDDFNKLIEDNQLGELGFAEQASRTGKQNKQQIAPYEETMSSLVK